VRGRGVTRVSCPVIQLLHRYSWNPASRQDDYYVPQQQFWLHLAFHDDAFLTLQLPLQLLRLP
jgi:hypothetical protein